MQANIFVSLSPRDFFYERPRRNQGSEVVQGGRMVWKPLDRCQVSSFMTGMTQEQRWADMHLTSVWRKPALQRFLSSLTHTPITVDLKLPT